MSKKIVFKYTSRSRPDNFFRGLRSIIDNCVDNNYEVLCSFDEDDKSMNNPFEIGGLGVGCVAPGGKRRRSGLPLPAR